MSREHLEATRRVFEAFGVQRDAEAALDYLDEEVELRSAISGGPEGNTYRGHQGVRDWMAESPIAWLCEFRAERIVRARGYLDLEEARRSAALAAQ